MKKSVLKKASALAFSQVANSKEVRQLFMEIAEKAEEHISDLSEIMHKNNLSSPRTWDSDITTITTSPFSDKLMMFHIGFKLSAAIAYYGSGMATSMRTDVITTYSNIILGVMKEANEWLEKQPEAADRKSLAQR